MNTIPIRTTVETRPYADDFGDPNVIRIRRSSQHSKETKEWGYKSVGTDVLPYKRIIAKSNSK